jgi:hypothetical protein
MLLLYTTELFCTLKINEYVIIHASQKDTAFYDNNSWGLTCQLVRHVRKKLFIFEKVGKQRKFPDYSKGFSYFIGLI